MLKTASCTLAALALSGCAWVHHERVLSGAEQAEESARQKEIAKARPKDSPPTLDEAVVNGIYYYQSSPYLLVYSDGKDKLQWKIIHLPDQTKKMVARPENILASLETTMTFENGVLKVATDVGDETAIGKAIIDAAKGVLSQGLKMALGGPSSVPFYLYKIEVARDSAKLYAANDVTSVREATVPQQGGITIPLGPQTRSGR